MPENKQVRELFEKIQGFEPMMVDSRDAKLHMLYSRYLENPTHFNKVELDKELTHREETDLWFSEFVTLAMIDPEERKEVSQYECLRSLKKGFEASKGRMSSYALKYVKHFVNVCETYEQFLALEILEKALLL